MPHTANSQGRFGVSNSHIFSQCSWANLNSLLHCRFAATFLFCSHSKIATFTLPWEVLYVSFQQSVQFNRLVARQHMTPERALKPSNALTGMHGLHLVSHSPVSFQEIKQHVDFNEPACGTANYGSNQQQIVQRVWHQRPSCLRPICCKHNGDKNFAETVVNVLTSIPFIALGLQAPRKNLNCKIYANSLIGVGVASSVYHASRGKLKKYLRWADYTMIATATVCMSRALRKENPKLLMAASAFFLPIQPLMVSAVHTGMMEVAFAKRAFEDPDLRMAHNVHKMSSLLGGALFIADDLLPQTPFLHAGWHLAAAIGVSTCNKLLE